MRDNALKVGRLVVINVALIVGIVVVFDVVAYFALPATFSVGSYRVHTINWQDTIGNYIYPRTYYIAHPERGFDIAPSSGKTIVQPDYFFPIERNDLGCRDARPASSIPDGYIYAAGDSETWALVPSKYRWTEKLAAAADRAVLNCGVSGTAQAHQHDKYREVIGRIGQRPQLVVVGYVANDVDEDFVYPGRTTIDGYLVDTVSRVEENGQARRVFTPLESIRAHLEVERERLQHGRFVRRISWLLKEYSLSARIAVNLLRGVGQSASQPAVAPRYAYDMSWAEPNKTAISSFAEDVCAGEARFSLLILPDTMYLGAPDYFDELATFLEKQDIHYVNLHRTFAAAGHTAGEMALIGDPHFSIQGNALIGAEIAAVMKKQGDEFGRCRPAANNG